MILKLTIHDNDFSADIAEFCKNLRDKMFTVEHHPELKDPTDDFLKTPDKTNELIDETYEKFKIYDAKCDEIRAQRRRLMQPGKHFKANTDEYNLIKEEVLRLWVLLANDHVRSFKPDVNIVPFVKEQDENGEVVYYFTAYNVTIVT
ncbi:hypothetical protein J6A31_04465 [bacterium]|nr:hypothetical protein [bacterium]